MAWFRQGSELFFRGASRSWPRAGYGPDDDPTIWFRNRRPCAI